MHVHPLTLRSPILTPTLFLQQMQSKSGPQTPVSRPNLGDTCGRQSDDTGDHESRCIFNKLLRTELAMDRPDGEDRLQRLAQEANENPRKQYVAVQQGRDIPLKGLRKPAPQPNVHRGELVLATSRTLPTSERLLKLLVDFLVSISQFYPSIATLFRDSSTRDFGLSAQLFVISHPLSSH